MLTDPWTIFYTDDDKEDQQTFIDAVQEVSENVQVTTQTNGDDLLKLLNNPPPLPTVIFLDLNMPVKNGFEVLKEMKQNHHTRNLPVIIFTTSDHSSAIETSRKLGATLYVPKPLSFNVLKKVISHILAINWKTFIPSAEEFVYRGN